MDECPYCSGSVDEDATVCPQCTRYSRVYFFAPVPLSLERARAEREHGVDATVVVGRRLGGESRDVADRSIREIGPTPAEGREAWAAEFGRFRDAATSAGRKPSLEVYEVGSDQERPGRPLRGWPLEEPRVSSSESWIPGSVLLSSGEVAGYRPFVPSKRPRRWFKGGTMTETLNRLTGLRESPAPSGATLVYRNGSLESGWQRAASGPFGDLLDLSHRLGLEL